MAERRAQQKYIPPDFDPQLHGSVNGYHNSHPLRERARLLHKGILIIRFEMPYSVWCLSCNEHIGIGVRFNAQKKKVDMYYTTPIYEFKMKCHLCSGEMVIRTDPKNTDYICVSGVRRKVEDWEPSPEENGQIALMSDETRKRLAEDQFFAVEHQVNDEQKLNDTRPRIAQLQEYNDRMWGDNYSQYKKLRKRFRDEQNIAKQSQSSAESIQDRFGIGLAVLPPSESDTELAKLVHVQSQAEKLAKAKRLDLKNSIFSKSSDPFDPRAAVGQFLKKQKLEKILQSTSNSKKAKELIKRPQTSTGNTKSSAPLIGLVADYDSDDTN